VTILLPPDYTQRMEDSTVVGIHYVTDDKGRHVAVQIDPKKTIGNSGKTCTKA